MNNVRISISRKDYSELIQLLDQRIRSERARMSAFRGLRDTANAYAAEGRRDRLLSMRNALVEGCTDEGVDDV